MALERTHIVAVALELLDRTGLDGLTMRHLATALGVRAPSLYHHFPDKAALLAEMANALLGGMTLDFDSKIDFPTALRQVANEFRQALLRHRDGARLFTSAPIRHHNGLRMDDHVIGILMRAGFDAATAVRGNFALFHFVLGAVGEEQALSAQFFDADMVLDFPNIGAALPQLQDRDPEADFAFGVDLVIFGLSSSHVERHVQNKGINSFIELLQHPFDSKNQV